MATSAKDRTKGTIREHVKITVRAIVASMPEMARREFHYGIVPKDAPQGGIGVKRQEWSLIIARIIQALMSAHRYPRIPVGAATSATWSVDLTTGIDAITELIWNQLHT